MFTTLQKIICVNHIYLILPTIVVLIIQNDEKYQPDATIVIYYNKYLYMFRASICPSSGVQVVCTAYGVQQ